MDWLKMVQGIAGLVTNGSIIMQPAWRNSLRVEEVLPHGLGHIFVGDNSPVRVRFSPHCDDPSKASLELFEGPFRGPKAWSVGLGFTKGKLNTDQLVQLGIQAELNHIVAALEDLFRICAQRAS